MWPTFEISLNVLTGYWMPWLEKNRLPQRFEALLMPFGPLAGHTSCSFFSTLAPLLQIHGEPVPEKVMQELKTLAGEKYRMGHSPASAFLNLPYTGAREQFYNALTGFCLQGYTTWVCRLTSYEQENEVAAYLRTRMLNTLHHLIHVPLPTQEASRQELEIALRVKAALCVIYSRLKKKQGVYYRNIPQAFTAREEMNACLEDSSLEEASRRQIMHLFENLSDEKPKSAPMTVKSARYDDHRELISKVMEPELSYLTGMVAGMGSDINEVIQVLNKYMLMQEQPLKKSSQEASRVIDSAAVRRMLSIGKSSLQRYRNNGLLPFTKIGGKYTYLETDVMNLINNGKNKK